MVWTKVLLLKATNNLLELQIKFGKLQMNFGRVLKIVLKKILTIYFRFLEIHSINKYSDDSHQDVGYCH